MKIKLLFISFALLQILPEIVKAQEQDSIFDKNSKTFTVAPLIVNNPALKTGLGAMAMYFFKFDKEDTISPASNVRLLGLYSTNKSYFAVAGSQMFWNEDRNRSTLAFGTLSINNDFTYDTENGDVQLIYNENRKFLTYEYSRKIIGEFYLGVLYLGTKTTYTFDNGTDEQNEFTEEFFKQNGIEDNFVSSIGLNFSYDTRDYVYYPTKGLTFSVRPKLNASWLGSDNDYVDTDYKFVHYTPLASDKVLAVAISGGFAFGDVPFDGYQNYGVRNTLRGYQTGKYKGKHMVALQAEYRWNIYKRWGAVGFLGTGSIWGNENSTKFFEREWLPSAGAGIRFMISREKKLNLRLDYAFGVDGNQGLYFGFMEAF